MTPEQIAIGAGAAALIFWPQLTQAMRTLAAKGGAPGPLGGAPVDRPQGLDRSAAVVDLLRLQGQMREAGLLSASDLAGRLVVELVTYGKGNPPPPAQATRARR